MTAPAAPIGLTAKHIGKSPGPVILSWTEVPGARFYTVEKKLVKTSMFLIVSNSVTVPTFTDQAKFAQPGTQYRVSATTVDGTSPFSEPCTL